MAWIETVAAPNDFIREFVRILCTANRVRTQVTGEELTTTDRIEYKAANANWDYEVPVKVYVNGELVEDGYVIDYKAGTVRFLEPRADSDVVTADYTYVALDAEVDPQRNWELVYPDPLHYREKISVADEVLTTEDNQTYRGDPANLPWDRGTPVVVKVNGQVVEQYSTELTSVEGQELVSDDRVIFRSPHTNWDPNSPIEVYANGARIAPTRRLSMQQTGELLATDDYLTYRSSRTGWDPGAPVKVYSNGVLIPETREQRVPVSDEALLTVDRKTYSASRTNWDPTAPVTVKVNGGVINRLEQRTEAVTGEQLTTTDRITYRSSHPNWSPTSPVTVYVNGVAVAPTSQQTQSVTGIVLSTTDRVTYASPHVAWDVSVQVKVYSNGVLVSPTEYTVNYTAGTIRFNTARSPSETITADYGYIHIVPNYTVDFVNGAIIFPTARQLTDIVTADYAYMAVVAVYDIDYVNGQIIFAEPRSEGDWVTASYGYLEQVQAYTVDHAAGIITFTQSRQPDEQITVDYGYLEDVPNYTVDHASGWVTFTQPQPDDWIITADYAYFRPIQAFSVNFDEGSVTFTEPRDPADTVTASYAYVDVTDTGFDAALAAIKNEAVIRTTTTPDANGQSLTMYLQLQKPTNLINPDIGLPYWADASGRTYTTPLNHHGIRMRLLDAWDRQNQQVPMGAHASAWAYLEWYRTFEEVLVGEVDPSVPLALEHGVVYKPVELPETAGAVPVAIWGNVSNDRAAIVVMGDPGISIQHYLSSFVYLGRVEPFEGGQTDTLGNFVLSSSGATLPTKEIGATLIQPISFTVSPPPMGYPADGQEWTTVATGQNQYVSGYGSVPVYERRLVGEQPLDTLGGAMRYLVIGRRDDGGYVLPSEPVEVRWIAGDKDPLYSDAVSQTEPPYYQVGKRTPEIYLRTPVKTNQVSNGAMLTLRIPPNIVEVKIYRTNTRWTVLSQDAGVESIAPVPESEPFKLVHTMTFTPGQQQNERIIQWTDPNSTNSPGGAVFQPPSIDELLPESVRVVRRHPVLRTMQEAQLTDIWGPATGTGTLDSIMYRTYRGDYYQRHDFSLIVPGEGQVSHPFQPSAWTGHLHISPIVVTHFVDGERGMLADCLAVLDRSVVYGDTIYVDKDKPTQKVYRFFRVTAPLNPFVNSANPIIGVAIRSS